MKEKTSKRMGRPPGSVTYTDAEIAEALRDQGGMPTKAAEKLGADYTTIYKRIQENADLQQIQKASRARLFDELQTLTLSAVKTGLMPQLLPGENGDVLRDEDGNPVKTHIPVDPQTRLQTAAKIMGVLKSDAGIVERTETKTEHSGQIGFNVIDVMPEDAKLGDKQ